MDINGCRIEVELDGSTEDGFRVVSVTKVWDANGPVEKGQQKPQSPFGTIYAAQKYAMSWKDADNPPVIPNPEPVDPMKPKKEEAKEPEQPPTVETPHEPTPTISAEAKVEPTKEPEVVAEVKTESVETTPETK